GAAGARGERDAVVRRVSRAVLLGGLSRRGGNSWRVRPPASAAAAANPAKCESFNRRRGGCRRYFQLSRSGTTVRTAFIFGVVLGLAGILAAAKYAPWVSPERLPSHTSVVANGGRAEAFVIRLPADRLSAQGGEGVGIRGGTFPSGAALPEPFAA